MRVGRNENTTEVFHRITRSNIHLEGFMHLSTVEVLIEYFLSHCTQAYFPIPRSCIFYQIKSISYVLFCAPDNMFAKFHDDRLVCRVAKAKQTRIPSYNIRLIYSLGFRYRTALTCIDISRQT